MTSPDVAVTACCRHCGEPITWYVRVPGEEPKWWHRSGMRLCRGGPTDTAVAEPEDEQEQAGNQPDGSVS